MSLALRLELKPDWDEVEQVHTRAQAFLSEQGLTADVVDAIVMACCELTENAIKYGSYLDGDERIGLRLEVDEALITVELSHLVGQESSQHLARLDRMVQWIRGFQDPFQAYVERIKEVSAQSLYSGESGLGLVRIAYEGQCILDFYVSQDSTLAVSAVYERV